MKTIIDELLFILFIFQIMYNNKVVHVEQQTSSYHLNVYKPHTYSLQITQI